MRGEFIAFKVLRDKENEQARAHLASEIKRLEEDLKQNQLPQTVESLQAVYDELKLLNAHKIVQEVL